MRSRTILASLFIATTAMGAAVIPSQAATFRLQSADFANGQAIPVIHEGVYPAGGCKGKSAPLTLKWSGAPMGTTGYALTMIDPDVKQIPGGFVHWVVYNIPATAHMIGPKVSYTYSKGTMGANIVGYFGPCPPTTDPAHHYHLTLYALNVAHIAGAHLTNAKLQAALKGHILGKATLVGLFKHP